VDQFFLLTSDVFPDGYLRSIAESDCENLRAWKNKYRHSFFYQEVISPEDQIRWFQGYLSRTDDYMFMVGDDSDVGCMGFRLLEGKIDVYNVIRGIPDRGRKGLMRQAIQIMCAYALSSYGCEVGCKVLIYNPAIAWYEGCGFFKRTKCDTYFEMVLNQDLTQIPFRVEPCKRGQ